MNQYDSMYPNMAQREKWSTMCVYLTCILVRRRLRGVGDLPAWCHSGCLEITFTTPLPDCPKDSTCVYYRCVPLMECKTFLPFWRAKGVMKKTPCVQGGLVHIDSPEWQLGDQHVCLQSAAGCVKLPLYTLRHNNQAKVTAKE